MTSQPLPVTFGGTELWLLPEKAIFWPEQQTLLAADLHFGKAATFRRLGQPVPAGTTETNLACLDTLFARYPARRLIVLGDFLHAREARNPALMARLAQWRERHPALGVTLIRGNHDRRAGDPPPNLAIEVVDEPLLLGPFALQHEPRACPGRTVLAGHLHPAFRLRGRGRQSLRLPCFSLDPAISLLPAFGAFTGTAEVAPAPGRQIYVIAESAVWPVAAGTS